MGMSMSHQLSTFLLTKFRLLHRQHSLWIPSIRYLKVGCIERTIVKLRSWLVCPDGKFPHCLSVVQECLVLVFVLATESNELCVRSCFHWFETHLPQQ